MTILKKKSLKPIILKGYEKILFYSNKITGISMVPQKPSIGGNAPTH
jgi:hypothetical protein